MFFISLLRGYTTSSVLLDLPDLKIFLIFLKKSQSAGNQRIMAFINVGQDLDSRPIESFLLSVKLYRPRFSKA